MPAPRLATFADDGWRLLDGEQAAAAHPDTFWLPDAAARRGVVRGQVVRLGLEHEGVPGDQRVWAVVAEQVEGRFLGVLVDTPERPGRAGHLVAAAEVAFGPEHVLDVQQAPPAVVELMLGEPPVRRWADL